MDFYDREPDLAAANLLSEIDKAHNAKKYKESMKYFDFVALLTHFVGITMIILHGYLCGTHKGGFHWGNSVNGQSVDGYFNYHSFFMVMAMIFFQGEALMAYRIHRHEIKLLSKFIHTIFHFFAIVCVGVAYAAIYNMKIVMNMKHFVTYHSWLGGGIIIFYMLQFLGGFINFAFPKTPINFRRAFLPFHRKFGIYLLAICVAQVSVGHLYFQLHLGECSNTLSCEDHLDWIHLFSAISVILYTGLIYVCITKSEWKRLPTPDELKHD